MITIKEFKLQILAIKENKFKPSDGSPERIYYTFTVLLPDGDTGKVPFSEKATVGQSALMSLQLDRKTGAIVARCIGVV